MTDSAGRRRDDLLVVDPTPPAAVAPGTSASLRIRIEHAEEDDPDVRERVIRAIADVLSGRVG